MGGPEAAFWLAFALLAYTYLLYPATVVILARARPRSVVARRAEPLVSVVLVAHDEESRIVSRLENLLALDYPHDRLEILVASDGSTDRTAERMRARASDRVRVFVFAGRRGKAAVLNDLLPEARGDVVVFADARQRFEPSALRALVAALSDPSVGAASGELVLEADSRGEAREGVGVYWAYEKAIRVSESAIDSTVGATGAIYAIRRELFEPIPHDTILDDVLIPARIMRRGYRVVFIREALAYDRVAPNAQVEFQRKVRTIGGTFQLFAREHWLLDPRRNRLWLQTVSHKFLRLLSPALLVAIFVANGLLCQTEPIYRASFALQLVFYGAAFVGFFLEGAGACPRPAGVAYAFCVLNWATVVGFARFLTGGQTVAWKKAEIR